MAESKLTRSITIGEAFMENKSHTFNDLINQKRTEWNRVISSILNKIILDTDLQSYFNINPNNYIIDFKLVGDKYNLSIRHETIPIIYYAGGGAYIEYDNLINKINMNRGITILPLADEAPRTHDWDISFVLKPELKINNDIFIRKMYEILQREMTEKYSILNGDDDYMNNFEPISVMPNLEHGEKLLFIINNKIEVSYISRKQYINIRLNLVARVDTEYKKNHIVELVFWKTEPMQKINQIIKVNLDEYSYYVPLPINLIKSNLISLINRSIIPDRIAKCRQDYFRIRGIISRFETIYDVPELENILVDLRYVTDFLDTLNDIIPQCITSTKTREIFNTIIENIRANPARGEQIKRLLLIYYDYYINRIELEKEIKFGLTDLLKVLPPVKQESDYFQKKYLKYKEKYLQLKNNL